MAMINLANLSLRRNCVAGCAVAGLVRTGSVKANGQTPANLSYPRHLSPRTLRIDRATTWPVHVVEHDVDAAALRAGRSEALAGVLVSKRESCASASSCERFTLATPAFTPPTLQRRLWLPDIMADMRAMKQGNPNDGWQKPVVATPASSTRGETSGSRRDRRHTASR